MIKETEKFSEGTVFEGMVSISAVINSPDSNDRKIQKIIYDISKEKSKYKELSFLRHKLKELGFELVGVPSKEIDSVTIGNTHGGIVAFCTERTIPRLCNVSETLNKNGFYVMLEGIEDPYNFGYALRSLYAAGVSGIILNERNWMGAAGVISRASAGASEMLDMFIASGEDAIKIFREHNFKIVCAGIRNSVSIYDADMKKPIFLIIGGEKRGISASVLSEADQIVRICYDSKFKGSLSAASSATVIGFEIMRQNNNM